ncbi:MAG: right-handed parallel beta-helix repeat-containing protein [Gammaproteobacteria bacterium]|nr:right-handed parallel beta-helix repeat-containing protein [Gammaproteobacteria bacterium]
MVYLFKNWIKFALGLSLISALSACGVGDVNPDTQVEDKGDTIQPYFVTATLFYKVNNNERSLNLTFNGNTLLPATQFERIKIAFNEKIKIADLMQTVSINSKSKTELPELEWSFDASDNSITIQGRSLHGEENIFLGHAPIDVPHDTSLSLSIGKGITDLAGNTIQNIFVTDISAPKTVQMTAHIHGLRANSIAIDTRVVFNNRETQIVNGQADSDLISVNVGRVPKNYEFSIKVSDKNSQHRCSLQQGQLLTVSDPHVMIIHKIKPIVDTEFHIYCTQVLPQVETAAEWNDYYFPELNVPLSCIANNYNQCLHGGEKRRVSFSDSTRTCDDLQIQDELNAFDWNCSKTGDEILVTSDQLKAESKLSDLIDFENASWKYNRLFVNDINDNSEVFRSDAAPWWKNSIQDYFSAPGKSLKDSKKIYTLYNNGETEANYADSITIGQNNIALVADPHLKLNKTRVIIDDGDFSHIQAFVWLEGNFELHDCVSTTVDQKCEVADPNLSAQPVLSVNHVYYAIIDNSRFAGAAGTGVDLLDMIFSQFRNSRIENNGGNGLNIYSNNLGNQGSNYQAINISNNNGYAIVIDANNNYLDNINLLNNSANEIINNGTTNTIGTISP